MISINTYYKSQTAVAEAIRKIIDDYWGGIINEDDMIHTVNNIIDENQDKIFVIDKYSSIISQRCGKNRLKLIDKVRRIK